MWYFIVTFIHFNQIQALYSIASDLDLLGLGLDAGHSPLGSVGILRETAVSPGNPPASIIYQSYCLTHRCSTNSLTAGFDIVYPSIWQSACGSLAWDPSFKGDFGIMVVWHLKIVWPKYESCLILILSSIDIWHLVVSLIDVLLISSRDTQNPQNPSQAGHFKNQEPMLISLFLSVQDS